MVLEKVFIYIYKLLVLINKGDLNVNYLKKSYKVFFKYSTFYEIINI